ncbi:MAG: hypothetical protein IJ899_00875 [Blautia sp.]|nr:hypothetical protein [Blautia sp.]
MYRIVHPDGRIVKKDKKLERYYVRYKTDMDEDMDVFETEDLSEAESVLEATRRAWTDEFVIKEE